MLEIITASLAHTTIVFMRYAMLALESRNSNNSKTIGDLFSYLCDKLEDIRFSTSPMLVIELLRNILNPILDGLIL